MAGPKSKRIRAADAKRKEREAVAAEFLEYAEGESSEPPTPPPASPSDSPSASPSGPAPNDAAVPRAARKPAPKAARKGAAKAPSEAAPKGVREAAPRGAPQPATPSIPDILETRGVFEFDGEMSVNYVPPGQHRSLRACMVCSVVQTHARFQKDGCPNCESFLSLAGNPDAIAECTSQVFEGAITVADPTKSWVARWQRIDGYVPGVYAAKVVGILPEDVIVAIEEAGLRYIPRDGSEMDEAAAEP